MAWFEEDTAVMIRWYNTDVMNQMFQENGPLFNYLKRTKRPFLFQVTLYHRNIVQGKACREFWERVEKNFGDQFLGWWGLESDPTYTFSDLKWSMSLKGLAT